MERKQKLTANGPEADYPPRLNMRKLQDGTDHVLFFIRMEIPGIRKRVIGGFRSAHLFGLDPRISVCIDADWMTSYVKQIDNHLRHHTWMIYVPHQLEFLDLPDVISLSVPRPLMIINCNKDQLYTLEAMHSAADKIDSIYKKLGASDRYKTSWYDVPHSLNIEMQNDAISWLEKWLKK